MRTRLVLTMALTVMSLAVSATVHAAPVHAAPDPAAGAAPDVTRAVALAPARLEDEMAEVEALAPYWDSSTGTLDAESALASGADPETVRDFLSGFAAGRAALAAATAPAPTLTGTHSAAASQCYGVQTSVRKLTYVQIWLNSCGARTVVSLMTAGAGAATVTGAIAAMSGIGLPYTAIAGVVAGLFSIGSAAVQYCSRNGRGMVARTVLWPPCYNQ